MNPYCEPGRRMNPHDLTPTTTNGRALALEAEEQQFRAAVGVAEKHFNANRNATQTALTLPNGRVVLVRRDGLFSMRAFDEKTGVLLFSSNPSAPFALAGTGYRPRSMKWPK